MSLSDLIFHHRDFLDKYDCSRYNVDIIPLVERQNIPVGTLFLSLGALCELFYLPCLWAIYQQIKSNRFATCYTFMFYLGVVDAIGLLDSGFLCGTVSIKGMVFCQAPITALVTANVGLFGWFSANTTTLILAINRCMVIYDDDLADRLFKGRRGTLWLIIPITVGLVGMFVSPPVFYNPMDSSALFNPHRHYLPDEPFVHGTANLIYNWLIVIAIPTIYVIFAVCLANRLRSRGMLDIRGSRKLAKDLSTFLQVLMTSIFVMSTSIGFIYQEYLVSHPIFVYVAYIIYQGSPAFIYLCMNQSIRNTLLAKAGKVHQSTNFAASNVISTREQSTRQNIREQKRASVLISENN
ncbi:serpentine type 7TM GPCR chemoreceptor srt domain-containing protein [Ditylenchus destructor]|uniref:Serpentine type 7TM GPCR chemoreceptor srt domain-containing protein n=1 Tax=Ditylenchus destructor TaxID=166010 RepID=A0AAD4MIK8_9BILA|nr:serpentine type 7TM GPCR chemoreceptor srt domain-containing protein [Ditylenchus destructor]